MSPFQPSAAQRARDGAAGIAAWALTGAVLLFSDGRLDLANQAMLLVLGGVAAALWLPAPAAVAAGLGAVLLFNWGFVPPRGSWRVDAAQHGLLLGAMALVNGVVALLMSRLRGQARQARCLQQRAEQLRRFGDSLRDADDPLAQAGALHAALQGLVDRPASLLLCRSLPATAGQVLWLGTPDAEESAALWHGLRQGLAMGPGTTRHGALGRWVLPLRGSGPALGAACLRLPEPGPPDAALRDHAQALCDQMGMALQRWLGQQSEAAAREQAQLQAVRNALLTAISHDHRTPLANILGAASSLHDQADRLDAAQRRTLAARIVQEAEHLARLTDNTLQLARLDAPGVVLRQDWESAEELVGTVLRRARQRAPGRALRARLEPGLPLLRCDAMLLTQLLDNLVDNALHHTPPDSPVEILVRQESARPATAGEAPSPACLVLAVRDRGPGVSPAWRERIFEVFQRGDADGIPAPPTPRRGAGVGLAVCRAIARAHGGDLRLRARAHGGCSFECRLPLAAPPAGPLAETAARPAPDGAAEPAIEPAVEPAPEAVPAVAGRSSPPRGRP